MNDAAQTAPEKTAGYRVLARKYRPRDFSALIGQEPMVRTPMLFRQDALPRPGC